MIIILIYILYYIRIISCMDYLTLKCLSHKKVHGNLIPIKKK